MLISPAESLTMTRLIRQIAVLLLLVSFALAVGHSYLLDEQPCLQRDCPFCQWLHVLTIQEIPAIVEVGVGLVRPVSAELPLVFSGKPHRAPFAVRAPPSV